MFRRCDYPQPTGAKKLQVASRDHHVSHSSERPTPRVAIAGEWKLAGRNPAGELPQSLSRTAREYFVYLVFYSAGHCRRRSSAHCFFEPRGRASGCSIPRRLYGSLATRQILRGHSRRQLDSSPHSPFRVSHHFHLRVSSRPIAEHHVVASPFRVPASLTTS